MVEIKRIVGTLTDGTVVETEVDSIRLGGREVALIDHRPGANATLIKWLSEYDRAQLVKGLPAARKASGFDDLPELHGQPIHPAKLQAMMAELEGVEDE